VWWGLSLGIVAAVWEGAAGLQLIDPLVLPPPHLFIAEIQQQAQFLLPRIGVQRVGANFVALTAIIASLQRVLIGLLLAFGIGDGAAIFVVFIGIVFTLTLGTVNHSTHVDQVYINSARVLGASRR
jgi:NitT/TauT family transport system permease protein